MHRCFDPGLWIDPLDRLWFSWSHGNEGERFAVICENPDADELIWSPMICIGRGIMMHKPAVLSSGEWLFPLAVWNYNALTDMLEHKRPYIELYNDVYCSDKEITGANVYKTCDNGKTFRFFGSCKNIPDRDCEEHGIYEREDGALVMFIRTLQGIARSFSYDRGETWTDAYKFLPNPSARFHIRRLKSGRLLLINHHNYDGRNNLTAFLSEDEGNTWKYNLLLDERSNVSYPDVAEGDDGYIYVTYDRERGGAKSSLEEAESFAREILLAKINENDILNGEIVSKGSFLKRIISKLGKYEGKQNLYPEFPEIDTDIFVNTVCEYTDRNKILENLYVFYWLDLLNMDYYKTLKFDAIAEEILKCDDKENLKVLLYQIVEVLLSCERKSAGGKKSALVADMLKAIKNSAPKSMDIDAFAKENSISKKYLIFVFEKNTGISVDEYKEICNFAKTKEHLINSDDEVSSIAQKFGFENSDFMGRFMEKEGITPEKYRKYNKKKA